MKKISVSFIVFLTLTIFSFSINGKKLLTGLGPELKIKSAGFAFQKPCGWVHKKSGDGYEIRDKKDQARIYIEAIPDFPKTNIQKEIYMGLVQKVGLKKVVVKGELIRKKFWDKKTKKNTALVLDLRGTCMGDGIKLNWQVNIAYAKTTIISLILIRANNKKLNYIFNAFPQMFTKL